MVLLFMALSLETIDVCKISAYNLQLPYHQGQQELPLVRNLFFLNASVLSHL